MRRRETAVLFLGLTLGIVAAAAEPAAVDATLWRCHDNGHQELACTVQHAGAPQVPPTGLPPIVRDLRARPAAWRARTLMIPLFNQPYPDSPLQQLAHAVLCGTQGRCRVQLVAADTAQPHTGWADLADAHDPLLAALDD